MRELRNFDDIVAGVRRAADGAKNRLLKFDDRRTETKDRYAATFIVVAR